MLDQFYYESSDGAYRVDIGKDGIYVYSNDIRGYTWSYSEDASLLNFQKELATKSLPLVFIFPTYAECAKKRDEVFYIFERDVKMGKKGRIWINGYYTECNIISASNEGIIKGRYHRTSFEILSDSTWHKEETYQFLKVNSGGSDGDNIYDHPYDLPYDLGYSSRLKRQVINNGCIVNSDFILTIFGGAVSPLVEIAGHKYKVNGSISDTERIVVTSVQGKRNSILKYAQDGSFVDWFVRRYKEESIFEKIPEGNIAINWDGSFGFELTLIETRSEPVWYIEEENNNYIEPEQPEETEPEEEEGTYLIDSDGAYIVDAGGEEIEVA